MGNKLILTVLVLIVLLFITLLIIGTKNIKEDETKMFNTLSKKQEATLNPAFDDFTLDGDRVYVNDSKVYIDATPATLSSSGYVTFNINSKVYTGDVDIVLGFNSNDAKPKSVELHKIHSYDLEHSYTCNDYFNYTLTPRYII